MSKLLFSSRKGKVNHTKVRTDEKAGDEEVYETYEIRNMATDVAARDTVQPEDVDPFLADQGTSDSDLYENSQFLHFRGNQDEASEKKGNSDSGYQSATRTSDSDLYENSQFLHFRGNQDEASEKKGNSDSGYQSATRAMDRDLYENRDLLHSRGSQDEASEEKGNSDSGYQSATRKKKKVMDQNKTQENCYANVEQPKDPCYRFSVDIKGGLFILHQIGVSVLVLEDNIKKESNLFVKQCSGDTRLSGNIPNAQLMSKLYELGPKKLKLRDPVTVKFPVDFSSHDVHKESISVCYCSGGKWEELPKHGKSSDTYFILGRFCSLKVTHPGIYAVIQKDSAMDLHFYDNVNSNNNNNELDSGEPWYATLCVTKTADEQFRAAVRVHQGKQEMPDTFDVRLLSTYNGTGNINVKLHLSATDAALIANNISGKTLTETQIHNSEEVKFELKQKKSCLGAFRITLKQRRSTYCLVPCCADEKIYLEFKGESFKKVKKHQPSHERYTSEPQNERSMQDTTQPYTYVPVTKHKNHGCMDMNTDEGEEKQNQHPESSQERQNQTSAKQQENVVEQLQRIPVLRVPSVTEVKCEKRERVLSTLTKDSQNYPFSSAFRNVMKTTLIDTIIQNEAELLSYVEEEICSGGKMNVDYLLQELFMDFSLDWHMVVYKGLVQISSPSSHGRTVADIFLLDIQKEKIRANMDRLCSEMKTRMVIERMYSDTCMKEFEKQVVYVSEIVQQQAKTLLEQVVLKSDTKVYDCFIKALKECNCQHLVDLVHITN